ncbi:MAG TPA: transporter substrate-binding domain-containing protein [Candidatus Avacidaminococcus intestinavium]|uniref:Transporter substrate-binding domain-containing protein n=1 Tax=Candidatus Avacidaminococcus intestinavium TaxID=2840684 RepID=A0A9D1MNW0_9FIRM|nr:transporter substrate-binding domain-containing protein [Candidatus Avacidaminococcus intestinavium]
MTFGKKLLNIAVCGVLLGSLFLVAGCGGEKGNDKQGAQKVLKVGMEAGYAPYNWTQTNADNGAVKIAGTSEYANGYDVIVGKQLAESMGATLEVHKIEWDGLAPAVASGKIDAAIAGMSITSKRKESVDFTAPYYYANVVGLVKKDTPQATAKSVADLKGAVATSQLNTIWYDLIDQVPDVEKLPGIENVPGMIVALTSGKCNLIVTDLPTAMAAAYANPELTVLEFAADAGFQTTKEDVEIGIAVKKGNKELVDAMNAKLTKMTEEDFKQIMQDAIKFQPLAK